MKHFSAVILIISLLRIEAGAQTIKGKIVNQQGDPVPYATVYISELRQGTTSNGSGIYELRLDPGKYKVAYQSLGYELITIDVELQKGEVHTRDVVLPMQYYQIPEVRITASGEDPAYIIMRKVIGMAPYYLNNIKHYKAEVYLKGNLVINKIPRLLAKQMTVEQGGKQVPLKKGDTFFMEAFNEIEFTAPNKYFQRVISMNTTFPMDDDELSPMEFIQASFYEPEIADMAISPLSPAAFGHYNFKYTGMSMQGEFTINKIQVTPKRKSQQLFEGTIFIIEDLWCLHSLDLVNENLAGKIRVQQLYVPVQDDIWMPVSHKFDANISFVGVQADAFYGSSVKYLEVQPNTALKKPETITVNYNSKQVVPDTASSKTDEQINKILSKDELTNRDMVRLSKLMEKKSEKAAGDTARKSLEVVDNTIQKVEKDAGKKDSAYWASIRPIPLSDIEKAALQVKDSIKTEETIRELRQDTVTGTEITGKKKKSPVLRTLGHIATGYTWRDTSGTMLRFGGLADIGNIGFNTVDGFVYGVDFTFSKNFKNKRLYIAPQFKWAFSREAPIWRVNSFFRLNNTSMAQVYARAGQASVDFNTGGGINLFLNTSFSLLLRRNYLKLYESGYFTLGYMNRITPGLSIDISGTYEDRELLSNNTSFSIFKPSRTYTENIPINEYLMPESNPYHAIRNMRHASFKLEASWTPFQRYRVVGNRKIPQGSDWPTFTLTWRHGINEFSELDDPLKHYDMFRFEAGRSTEIAAFSEFMWRIRAGGFLNSDYVTFYDFYHVNSQPLPLLLNNYEDAFRLPAFYTLSTPEAFFQAHVKYTTPYLAIKYLPFLSNTLMRENISLSWLSRVGHPNYYEVGYSISEIFLLAEIGVYAGFENLEYKSVGVALILKFN